MSGVKSVTIHDTQSVQWSDLSAQFFLNPSHVGQNRAEASFQRLQELNQYVPVRVATGELNEALIIGHNVCSSHFSLRNIF